MFYSQFELHTREQKINQIILLEVCIQDMKSVAVCRQYALSVITYHEFLLSIFRALSFSTYFILVVLILMVPNRQHFLSLQEKQYFAVFN